VVRRVVLVLVLAGGATAGVVGVRHLQRGRSPGRAASVRERDTTEHADDDHGGDPDEGPLHRRPDRIADRTAANRFLQSEVQARQISLASTPSGADPSGFTGAWSAQGPAPITGGYWGANSGRVTSVAVSKSGTIFVGTASGGVWSSTNGGTSWVTHTDAVLTGEAIGAIAVDPSNPQVVYAGTGEGNNCGDCFYGAGVLESTDAGQTWAVLNPGGIFTGTHFTSLAVDPNNGQRLYAGTDAGFYESTDAGLSWAHPSGNFRGPADRQTDAVVLDPTTAPTTVYIATEGVGIQKSIDGGVNFTTLGGGLPPASRFGVTSLGIGTRTTKFPTANLDLYTGIQLEGAHDASGGTLSLFKSLNGGTSWVHVTTPPYTTQWGLVGRGSASGDQAWYDNTLGVDPANPAHVYAGGLGLVETSNSGASWLYVNRVHVDFHAVAFTKTGTAIIGCDGGVYARTGSTVSDLNTNINTVQFYSGMDVYQKNGVQILGGTQDNGTVLQTGHLAGVQVLQGDGGATAINPLDPAQRFAEQNGELFRDATSIFPSKGDPAGEKPPLALVPNASAPAAPTLYYGGSDLFVTRNAGASPVKWTQLTHVGTTVSAIAVAPSNKADVYVGFGDGTVLVSKNATAAHPVFSSLSSPVSELVTHIAVDPANPGSIAVSFSTDYVQFYPSPPIVRTVAVTLSGTPTAIWTGVSGNLPSGTPSNSVVFDQGALVVATDVGVFFTTAPNGAATLWRAVGTGLPNVQVVGLTVDSGGNLYAATHGRGVWRLSR